MTQRGCEHTVDVPETRGSVVGCRENATAVGAEVNVLDQRCVPLEDRNLRAALDVPYARNTAHRPADEKFVVRAERAIDIEVLIGNSRCIDLRPQFRCRAHGVNSPVFAFQRRADPSTATTATMRPS